MVLFLSLQRPNGEKTSLKRLVHQNDVLGGVGGQYSVAQVKFGVIFKGG